ncbi:hypothetical protein [Arhodomonas aquaeolei]|uniref:hypothetical protein n=1 Tax=Arhodomonas aquaeolei TaxID=2369 RepID=UPI000369E5DF|nr:hypothetical protein [Arhodomonas aquaeolei]
MTTSSLRSLNTFNHEMLDVGRDISEGAMRSAACLGYGADGPERAYREGVAVARNAVERTIGLERAMVHAWRAQAREQPASGALWESALGLIEQGIDTRERLWTAWFRALEGASVNALTGAMPAMWGEAGRAARSEADERGATTSKSSTRATRGGRTASRGQPGSETGGQSAAQS